MKILITFCMLFSAVAMDAQDSITGTWNMGQENTVVEITEANGMYGGNIVSSDNSKAKIGNQILKDIKPNGGKWKGKMYSPKKDKWFDAVLEPNGDQLLVTVKAGVMSKTLEWKKE